MFTIQSSTDYRMMCNAPPLCPRQRLKIVEYCPMLSCASIPCHFSRLIFRKSSITSTSDILYSARSRTSQIGEHTTAQSESKDKVILHRRDHANADLCGHKKKRINMPALEQNWAHQHAQPWSKKYLGRLRGHDDRRRTSIPQKFTDLPNLPKHSMKKHSRCKARLGTHRRSLANEGLGCPWGVHLANGVVIRCRLAGRCL